MPNSLFAAANQTHLCRTASMPVLLLQSPRKSPQTACTMQHDPETTTHETFADGDAVSTPSVDLSAAATAEPASAPPSDSDAALLLSILGFC